MLPAEPCAALTLRLLGGLSTPEIARAFLVSEATVAQHIERGKRAKDPLITVSGLQHALEAHFQRGFSHQYVSKIADKVAREGLIEQIARRSKTA